VSSVRLVLVDDHPVIHEALRGVFSIVTPPIEVVGTAATARDAVAVVGEARPDVVILDLLLPGSNGLSAIRDVRRASSESRVVVYTALMDPAFAVEALAAGALGFVNKSDAVEELLAAIEAAARHESHVSPSVRRLMNEAVHPGDPSVGLTALSKREREIFDLIVKGHSSVEVAAQLFISVKTVETHRSRINKKLSVHSTGQLIRYAALNGLIAT
jgi:DNA-binding NarL/FixJ family response regulator